MTNLPVLYIILDYRIETLFVHLPFYHLVITLLMYLPSEIKKQSEKDLFPKQE